MEESDEEHEDYTIGSYLSLYEQDEMSLKELAQLAQKSTISWEQIDHQSSPPTKIFFPTNSIEGLGIVKIGSCFDCYSYIVDSNLKVCADLQQEELKITSDHYLGYNQKANLMVFAIAVVEYSEHGSNYYTVTDLFFRDFLGIARFDCKTKRFIEPLRVRLNIDPRLVGHDLYYVYLVNQREEGYYLDDEVWNDLRDEYLDELQGKIEPSTHFTKLTNLFFKADNLFRPKIIGQLGQTNGKVDGSFEETRERNDSDIDRTNQKLGISALLTRRPTITPGEHTNDGHLSIYKVNVLTGKVKIIPLRSPSLLNPSSTNSNTTITSVLKVRNGLIFYLVKQGEEDRLCVWSIRYKRDLYKHLLPANRSYKFHFFDSFVLCNTWGDGEVESLRYMSYDDMVAVESANQQIYGDRIRFYDPQTMIAFSEDCKTRLDEVDFRLMNKISYGDILKDGCNITLGHNKQVLATLVHTSDEIADSISFDNVKIRLWTVIRRKLRYHDISIPPLPPELTLSYRDMDPKAEYKFYDSTSYRIAQNRIAIDFTGIYTNAGIDYYEMGHPSYRMMLTIN